MSKKNKPEIQIVSVSGQGTNIALPRLKLGFDIGVCPDHAVSLDTIMITHGHTDHIGAIATHAARRSLIGAKPPTYIMHPRLTDDVMILMEAFSRMNQSNIPFLIKELSPEENISLSSGLFAEPFSSFHRIPTQGYLVYSEKNKLNPEFHGLSQEQIRELRASGDLTIERIRVPEYAYTGDATIKVVDAVEAVRKVKTLFLEVTFLDDKVSIGKAKSRGHIHLDEVIERADLFENERIYMMHFSARYPSNQIRSILNNRLPQRLLRKVTVLV